MEKRLGHIDKTVVRVDDILITGATTKEHLENLGRVLQVIEENGLRLKREKCKFFMSEVEFLGYCISAEGVKPIQEKIKSILSAPAPQNTGQVKSFLGMIQYYHRHLPDLASTLEPMHRLLRKDVKWSWGKEEETAFSRAKVMLTSENLLIHYNPELPIVLHTDASPYGLGAVLSHITKEGEEKPVAYVSRTLSAHERNYAHIEKEGLAVVYAVKKLHQYLYGQKFEIYTDHKPLLGLLGEHKPVSETAAARIQRWALLLSAYNYVLKYRQGRENGNADALSRLPRYATHAEVSWDVNEIHMMSMDQSPVKAAEIANVVRRDPILSKVVGFVHHGWPEGFEADESLKPFTKRKNELSVENGVLVWGSRVVIPSGLQSRVLSELHVSHVGMSRMKMLARAYVWWPNMDKDIESLVAGCRECSLHRKSPGGAPLHPWEVASGPWQRLHIDYAGPFMNRMFLIVSDAFSKWLDVHVTSGSTSEVTIEKLRHTFATHGLPEVIVSDNGSCFTSEEFKLFTARNGIRHVTSAPYHPSTNGLAERSVQTFKNALKKWSNVGGTIESKVERFLFSYRNTPHSTTGVCPAEMLMNRRPRTVLSMVLPSMKSVLQKANDDMSAKKRMNVREFTVGERVLARNYGGGQKWIPGQIKEVTGPVSYKVQIEGGILRKHVDQLLQDKHTVSRREEDCDDISDVEEVVDTSHETNMGVMPIQERGHRRVSFGDCPTLTPPEPRKAVATVPENEVSSQGDVAGTVNVPVETVPEIAETTTVRRSTRPKSRPAWMESGAYDC